VVFPVHSAHYLFIYLFIYICCTFHGFGLLACSNSALHSETMNQFRQFGRTFCTGDRSIVILLPIQDNTTQKNIDIRPCLERDSNPRSRC